MPPRSPGRPSAHCGTPRQVWYSPSDSRPPGTSGHEALTSNTDGADNTAVGEEALFYNLASSNTAFGSDALRSNTTGFQNTALGNDALYGNSTGSYLTAIGHDALKSNTLGSVNTAVGQEALVNNTIGNLNTAVGRKALRGNSIGSNNIALGQGAGYSTTGDGNILIGNTGAASENHTTRIGNVQTRAFIAGIRGQTTGSADAVAVLIDSNGQLGTVSSSGRVKQDVAPMAERSRALAALRPVSFRYKEPFADGQKPIQFGLIAEQVAEVFPELVVIDEQGKPETVKYHLLSSLLLNEFQKLAQRHTTLRDDHEALQVQFSTLEAQVRTATLLVQASAGSSAGWEPPR